MTLDEAIAEMHGFMGGKMYQERSEFVLDFGKACGAIRASTARANDAQLQASGFLSCYRQLCYEGYCHAINAHWHEHARPEPEWTRVGFDTLYGHWLITGTDFDAPEATSLTLLLASNTRHSERTVRFCSDTPIRLEERTGGPS